MIGGVNAVDSEATPSSAAPASRFGARAVHSHLGGVHGVYAARVVRVRERNENYRRNHRIDKTFPCSRAVEDARVRVGTALALSCCV